MRIIPTPLVLLVIAWIAIQTALAQPILVKSSDTLLGAASQWAKIYQAQHPEARIQVSGGTTADAFSALTERKASLILVPRGIRYQETEACEKALGKPPVDLKVGVNAVAVYVHPGNPVTVLSYDELEGIFRGKFTNWKDLGGPDAGVVALGQSTNTAAGELFVAEVLNGQAPASNVRMMSDKDIRSAIMKDPDSIGFGAFAPQEGPRAVTIKRVFSSTPVDPSEETISQRIYPITRFLFVYLDPTANQGHTKAYLDWIRSDEGQQSIRQAGFYPLAAKWRLKP